MCVSAFTVKDMQNLGETQGAEVTEMLITVLYFVCEDQTVTELKELPCSEQLDSSTFFISNYNWEPPFFRHDTNISNM